MLLQLSDPLRQCSGDHCDLSVFRHPGRARQNLQAIQARAAHISPDTLLRLLGESPDADQALNLLERLTGEADEQVLKLIERDHVLLHCALVIFGHSYWLGETIIHNQDVLSSLRDRKSLDRPFDREDYRGRFARFGSLSTASDVSAWLARFKKREYVRIAIRDLLGIATLAETTAEISALADFLIEEALREAAGQMRRRYGALEHPWREEFAVLALGKLGGSELNYSSDVDLLFLYSGHDSEGPLSLREYFIRQAQSLTDILARSTPEGAVFRIDLRLRPQGSEGEPAVSLAHALNYYAHAAHDWELQALIKVRHVAGDLALARRFMRGIEPHVYTRTINFEALETALHSRERLGMQRRKETAMGGAGSVDVKLDRGGIRDVEFLAQSLQRVYGGEERWLRPGGTLFSLQKLHDKAHLTGRDFHDLTLAYEFLRKVEHRLQLQRARQLHRLPSGEPDLQVLCRSVNANFPNGSADRFLSTLKSHMAAVVEIYERIVRSQKQARWQAEPFHLTEPSSGGARELSFDQVLKRIQLDSPDLYALVSMEGFSVHARRSLHRFLSSAMTSSERYAALLENSSAVERALELFDSSEYLTEILCRHPGALHALSHLSNPAEQSLFTIELEEPFASAEQAADESDRLAELRRRHRALMFSSGARDILYTRTAAEALLENSAIADAALRSALRIAGGEKNIAVFALGRLGTYEFDIASDADLIFVRKPETDGEAARSTVEKLVHALTTYTREGTLFAIDTRLRPRGAEGELVVTPTELESYLLQEAQAWEALTYSKLRFVAGNSDVADQVTAMVNRRIVERATEPRFAETVAGMRTRLEKANRFPQSFKLAPGGFYDVDFVASYLTLKSAIIVPENTEARLSRLQAGSAFSAQVLELLKTAAVLYRSVEHAIRLVTGRVRPELPTAQHARDATQRLVNRMLRRSPESDLQQELNQTGKQVREIFVQVFGSSSKPPEQGERAL